MKLRALALATAVAALAGCTPAPSAPTAETPPPTVLTGIVTDAAPMGYGYSASIVEVQDSDGVKTVYGCTPGWSKVCSLLKRGDIISFTTKNNDMYDVKRTKAAVDNTDPIKR